ncbi:MULTISPECIES: nucleotide pyrophosphohydrolase [unclassified Methylophilus]|uniref:nucleotide pyrophosphohydrolase n=1 Tax=unclassified Methylophilus TaxID=2630143 RepID=UPI000700D8B8|nr:MULTISPECIES: nucleotide pyrophosphohydrolase [unclassified Methylophilus]KQT37244.1 nucleotide pyrophosphohydrolase [Methylophilus sp. Leaf416]KQT55586.1 nucleotide pyrophosphohydrolase [Methylophilus sp. Leaf459]
MTEPENQTTDSLLTLRRRINAFVEARDWAQFHSPKNLAMAMIVEAAEVVEHFQWMTEQESHQLDEATKEKVGHELADTFVYLMRIAEVCGIDLIAATNAKIDLNAQKYPIEKCKGSNDKYTKYQ